MYWFLFNDVLVETKHRHKEGRYKPLRHTPLASLFVRDTTPPTDTQLELLYGGEGAATATFDTPVLKQRWQHALVSAVNSAQAVAAPDKERREEFESKRKPSGGLTDSQDLSASASATPVKKGSRLAGKRPRPAARSARSPRPCQAPTRAQAFARALQ